jgi:hypothetical protein
MFPVADLVTNPARDTFTATFIVILGSIVVGHLYNSQLALCSDHRST